jgi:polysaccharide deacetylase 2 family uncharacterized protein YibQ
VALPPPAAAPAKPVQGPAASPGAPSPIAEPDPALLQPVEPGATNFLPRIAADGRMPMRVYAAYFDPNLKEPKLGLMLAGVGLNQVDSEAAIRTLPGGITLAFSPYAQNVGQLLDAARKARHEFLVSIPMEPQGFALNDPGPEALMTNLTPDDNHQRLEWVLSRFAGYVGATGALGRMRGERFAALPEEMNPVLQELAQRGLLYIDPRPGSTRQPLAWSRTVDVVIDEPSSNPIDIDNKLAELARLAREKGSALGLATVVRPVTIQHVLAWTDWLPANGFALAPVSALVRPPEEGSAK